MRRQFGLLFATLGLFGSFAASAQDVLDRVETSRLEERKVDQVDPQRDAKLDVETEAASADGQTGESILVGAIEIVGLSELRNSAFSDIVQEFIGRSLSPSEVSNLADRLAARARVRFPLASARIAPQDVVGGILRVEIDEGRLDGFELSGFSNRRLETILQALVTGRPTTTVELERALLLARDLDGISIRETTIRREYGRTILVVRGDYSRFRGQLTVDNDTTKPIGPFEIFGFVQANGLISHDDSLQAYLLLALPQPEELGFVRLRYARRINDTGTEVSVAGSFSQSRPGSYLSPLDITSESRLASIGFSHPLKRSVRSSLWLDGSVSFRELRQERAGAPSRLDRLSVARLRLIGSARVAGGVLQSSGTLAQGLDVLDATRAGNSMASRPDADGTFTTLVLSGQWSRPIAGPLEIALGVRTQLASDPLLVSEEIGLGGARFARGYDYSERSGDQGTMGYLELAYGLDRKIGPFNGLAPYVFVDGGEVSNLSNGGGGGSLVSAGGGVRLDVDRRTDAAVEVAAPLSGDRYETDSQDARIRVSLTRHF